MTTYTLAERIESIGTEYGLSVRALTMPRGSVYTLPSWTDWPDAMVAEVRNIAELHRGRWGNYLLPIGGRAKP